MIEATPCGKAGYGPKTTAVGFCLLLSMLIFLFGGYTYGTRDHLEQLPMVLRGLDASYCTGDFFVEAGTRFGPRTYYVQILTFLSRFVPLPILLGILTGLSNFGVALITYTAARRLAQGSDLAAMVACALAMGTPAVTLGGILPLAQTQVTPSALAMPLALASLWAGLWGRPWLSVTLSICIVPIHPAVSFEIGAIALATVGLSAVMWGTSHPRRTRGTLTSVGAATLFLSLAIGVFWIRPSLGPKLETAEFIHIVAHFRHPHHYMPSTWSPLQYLWAIGFLAVCSFSWRFWRQSPSSNRFLSRRITVCLGIILSLWSGGYVFVELIPSRWWTTAQVFRLSFAVNWIGALIIGQALASMLDKRKYRMEHGSLDSAMSLVRTGLITTVLLLFLSCGVVMAGYGTLWESNRSLVLPAVIVWLLLYWVLRHRIRTAFLLVLLLLVTWGAGRQGLVPTFRSVIGGLAPAVTLTETHDRTIDVATFSQQNTSPNAVFLTPPNFGRFRLTARRAIVVDFKAFPFQDWAITQWRQRLEDCYGPIQACGFPAVDEMEATYQRINLERIAALQQSYDLSYAVLYAETVISLPILYSDRRFKLVALPSLD